MNVIITILAVTIAIVVIAFGIMSARFLFAASSDMSGALFYLSSSSTEYWSTGDDLTLLHSVGGQTVAEVYYQEMGNYGKAHSRFIDGHSRFVEGLGFLAKGLGYTVLMASLALAAIIILLIPRISRGGGSIGLGGFLKNTTEW